MSINKRGCPRYVPVVTFHTELFDKFWDACSTLNYGEIMALSRAFDVTPRTVRNWKYGKTMPNNYATVRLVIDWIERGKPMTRVKVSQTSKKYSFL